VALLGWVDGPGVGGWRRWVPRWAYVGIDFGPASPRMTCAELNFSTYPGRPLPHIPPPLHRGVGNVGHALGLLIPVIPFFETLGFDKCLVFYYFPHFPELKNSLWEMWDAQIPGSCTFICTLYRWDSISPVFSTTSHRIDFQNRLFRPTGMQMSCNWNAGIRLGSWHS
jgi:hypothetical protein